MALACRVYLSVDGQPPAPVWPDIRNRRVENSFVYRPTGTTPQKDPRIPFLTFSCNWVLNKPGKHTVRWILRPDPDSALLGMDCVEFWGGEYQTPELPYEYIPK